MQLWNRVLAFFVVAAFTVGCINSTTVIKVKPDGTGTIDQTLLMNASTLKTMISGFDPSGQASAKATGPFNEEELRKAADRMGKGVRFVSATPMKKDAFEGVRAVYAFDDINNVRVDQDPNLSSASSGQFSAPPKTSSPVNFKFTKQGQSSVLTISVDEKTTAPPEAVPPAAAQEKIDPAMMQMMKQMFQGFRVAIEVEVEGKIVKTNADHVTGSRVTMLEMDLGALLEDEAQLRKLQSAVKPGASIADVKPLLKDVKGIKINHSMVTIEFR
jgi:hypothetical protein